MSANPLSDQLAATIADQRKGFTPAERVVGGALADKLSEQLAHIDIRDIGEVLMYAAQFVAGMTEGAAQNPSRGTPQGFGQTLTFALSEAGQQLYTGGAR